MGMCGIAGIIRFTPAGQSPRGIPEEWIDALDASIAWRGPDGRGTFRDETTTRDGQTVQVALIHRRLAILDIAGGRQPMVWQPRPGSTPDDRLALTFNGCLYNHRQLRTQLAAIGHHFTTDHSDTEALLHLCKHRRAQRDNPTRSDPLNAAPLREVLQGMYAYAAWDRAAAMLTLARDPHGEKPLWITQPDDSTLAFASTVAALRAFNKLSTAAAGPDAPAGDGSRVNHANTETDARSPLDRAACVDWFALGWSSMRSPLRSIVALSPGEEITIDAERLAAEAGHARCGSSASSGSNAQQQRGATRWPSFSAKQGSSVAVASALSVTPAEAMREVGRRLDAAVRDMLDADVPVGLFLSGGVDSSLVAHYACKHAGTLPAFCVRMPDAAYDESEYARLAARSCGAELCIIDPPADPLEDLKKLIAHIGVPFSDSSLLPTWWLCRGARERIKVALSGDGGDELFLGYERQRIARFIRNAKPLIALLPMRVLDRRDPKSRQAKLARLIEACRGAGGIDLLANFPLSLRRKLLRAPAQGELANSDDYPYDEAFDRQHYLPGDLMLKADTASMAAHLEARSPMLHPLVSDYAMRLPRRVLLLNNQRKGLLRALAKQHYAAAMIDRPKMGFALPIGRWFREDHAGFMTTLRDGFASSSPFGELGEALGLNIKRLQTMLDEHQAGSVDHGQRLFGLLVMVLWAK